jgi:hypothetical protein
MERGMLKINDRFTIDRDKHNIIIIETYEGKDRFGQPKQMTRESYHSTMLQACGVIIDKSAGVATIEDITKMEAEGKTVDDVVDAINAAKRDILNALKEV